MRFGKESRQFFPYVVKAYRQESGKNMVLKVRYRGDPKKGTFRNGNR